MEKIFSTQNELGILRVSKNDIGGFDFLIDGNGKGMANDLSPYEIRALADAIYKELGLGWKAYPEHIPTEDKYYLIKVSGNGGGGDWSESFLVAEFDTVVNDWLSPFGGLMEDEYTKVLEFMEILE